jgi:hypothetical protein
MFVTKKCVFRDKLRCDALDIKVQILVHKQDVCTIQKNDKGIRCIDFKDLVYWTFLVGHEKPSKNVISWTVDLILGDIKLK